METKLNFKLTNSKPDKDFIEWNELMSKNYNQDDYYFKSNPFIVWVEKLRLVDISNSVKEFIYKNNLKNPTVLEVGCGAGHVLDAIKSKVGTKDLIGLDPLDDWRDLARKRLGDEVKLIKGFAEDLPFENDSIDCLVCSEVLEHIIDPSIALNEFKRVIRKDGVIITSIPNETIIDFLKNIINFLKVYNLLFPNIQKDNEWHIHDFDLKLFNQYLPVDLKIIRTKAIPSAILPLRYVISLKKV